MDGITVSCSAIKQPQVEVKPEPAGVTFYVHDGRAQKAWACIVVPLPQLWDIIRQCEPDLAPPAVPEVPEQLDQMPEVPEQLDQVPEVPEQLDQVPEVPRITDTPHYHERKRKKRRED